MSINAINQFSSQWLFCVWHIAWQGAAVGLIALLFSRWGQRVSSSMRYGLLLVAMAKFVVPPLMTSPTGVFGFLSVQLQETAADATDNSDTPDSLVSAPVVSVPASESRVGAPPVLESPRGSLPERFEELSSNGPGMLDLIGDSVVAAPANSDAFRPAKDVDNAIAPAASLTKAQPASVDTGRPSLTTILMLLHVFGTWLGLSMIIFRVWQLRRSLRSMTVPPDAVLEQFAKCAGELQLKSVPELWVTSAASVPFSFGILRPAVVISQHHLNELPEDELRTVFLHELAHHRRFDLCMLTAQAVVTALWWFHPIVWLLNRRVRVVREDCCDDLLLKRKFVTDDGYCQTLLRVARLQVWTSQPALAVTMADREPSLSHRFRRIMDERLPRRDRMTWLAACTLLLTACVFLPGISTASNDDKTTSANTAAEPDPSDGGDQLSVAVAPISDEQPANKRSPDTTAPETKPFVAVTPPETVETSVPPRDASNKPVRPVVEEQKWPEFITVRVLAPDGKPIEKAKVVRSIDQKSTDFFTDSKGRVKIPTTEAAPKSTSFSLTADVEPFVQFYIWWRFGKAPGVSEYHFLLEEGRTISGKVVDTDDATISGVGVRVSPSPDNNGRVWPRPAYPDYTTITDESGKWQVGRIPKKLSSVQLQLKSNQHISDPEPVWQKPKQLEHLLAGTHKSTMRTGVLLSGRVVNEDGQPIAGVKLRLADDGLPDHFDMPETDAAGRFEFPHCPKMETILLGYKPGFAPFAKPVDIGTTDQSVECQMNAGRSVRVRVTDRSGQPIEGVSLMVHEFSEWPVRGAGAYGELRLAFGEQLPKTDADGMWIWTWAPHETFGIEPSKRHWHDVQRRSVTSETNEVSFTLVPEVVVVGEVLDDETGEPVDHFEVTPGSGKSWHDWMRKTFRRGRFRKSIDNRDESHRVRIEADGYLPAESRVIRNDEGRVSLNFRMKRPENQMTIRILAQDGTPEANASVIVATKEARAYIRANLRSDFGDARTFEADKNGRLILRPQSGAFTAYVIGSSGFAMVDQRAFTSANTDVDVRTTPWARVEGVAKRNGKVLPNYPISLSFDERRPFAHFDFDAITDEQGRFVFDRVPAAWAITVAQVHRERHGRITTQTAEARARLQLAPGEIRALQLGGSGVNVTGQLIFNGDNNLIDWKEARVIVSGQNNDAPETGVRYLPAQQPKVTDDGTFVLTDVPTGRYRLSIHVYRKGTVPAPAERPKPGSYVTLGQRSEFFDVSDEDVQLGELPIYPEANSAAAAPGLPNVSLTQLVKEQSPPFRLNRKVVGDGKKSPANVQGILWYVEDGPAQRQKIAPNEQGRIIVDGIPGHGAWLFVSADGYRTHGEYVDAKSATDSIQLISSSAKLEGKVSNWPAVDDALVEKLNTGLQYFATESKDALDQHFRFDLERLLAHYVPEFALQFHAEQSIDFAAFGADPKEFSPWHDSTLKHFAAEKLAKTEPERAEEVILSIDDPKRRCHAWAKAALQRPPSDNARSRQWLRNALQDARVPGDGKSLTRVFRLTDVAKSSEKLGDTELFAEALDLAVAEVKQNPLRKDHLTSRMSLAAILAATDEKTALALLPDIPPRGGLTVEKITAGLAQASEKQRKEIIAELKAVEAYGKVAVRLAPMHHAKAERLLSRLGEMGNSFVAPICYRIARSDLNHARRIAGAYPDKLARAHALGAIAHAVADQPAAPAIIETAYGLLETIAAIGDTDGGNGSTALKVGLSLLPTVERIDPGLVPEYMWRTLSFRGGNTIGGTCGPYGCPPAKPLEGTTKESRIRRIADPVLAAVISRFDVEAARQLAIAPGDTTLNNSLREAPFFLMGAVATIDPEAAVNAVLKMPHTNDAERKAKLSAFKQVLSMLTKSGDDRWDELIDETIGVWRVGKSE